MVVLSVWDVVESGKLLPAQFCPGVTDSPETALMRAVLQRAIDDLAAPQLLSYQGARGAAKLQRDTAAWFASDDTTWPYSFVNICLALNLDVGAIRRALLGPQREAA